MGAKVGADVSGFQRVLKKSRPFEGVPWKSTSVSVEMGSRVGSDVSGFQPFMLLKQ
jgi:hypothetical protein